MIRCFTLGLAAAVFGVALGVAAGLQDPQEPPVRLKKKTRADAEPAPKETPRPPAAEEKQPEPKQPDEPEKPAEKLKLKKADEPPEPEPEPELDVQEILGRVSKNMRVSEERLGSKEIGESTQQVQRDILKDLDALIELSKQQSGGASSDSQDQQSQPNQQGQRQQQASGSSGRRNQQQARGNRRGQRNQQMAQGQQQGQGQQRQGQGQQQDMARNGTTPEGGGRGTGPEEANKIADVYKDVWGHLPETLRAEMMAYSREQFMAKYKDVIEQYYTTLAEKGRRKGD